MKISKWLVGALLMGTFSNGAFAQSHNFNWSQPMGSSAADVGTSITSDPSGNIISAGYFSGTIDFEDGPGVTNLTSNGGTDIYVKKTDADGNLIWAKSLGSTTDDVANGIATDILGQVYLSGYFSGTMDADPGTGVNNLTTVGSNDIFVIKLDVNGDFMWGHGFGSSSNDVGREIAVDVSGSAYVSGFFYNTIDFDPGVGVANVTSNGGADAFMFKLDADGNYEGAWNFGSTGNDDAADIETDDAGNMYLSGYFTGSVDFDPGVAVQTLVSNGSADAFVLKFSNSGQYEWAFNIGGSGTDDAQEISLDNQGNVIVSGFFYNTADFDPGIGVQNLTSNGSGDFYIAKYDPTGQYIWAHGFGSNLNDAAWSHDTDADDNVYVTGFFRNNVDFDPGPGTAFINTGGTADIFILKLNADGEYNWAYNFGGPTDAHGFSVHIDANDAVNTTGYYANTTDFDPGSGTSMATPVGGLDIFQLNLKSCADYKTDVIAACGDYTWIDGNTYTASNYTAVDTLTNQNGCDSIVSLHLTITNLSDLSVTPSTSLICGTSGSATITTGSSDNGVTYYLRDDSDNSIVDGPIVGDGNGMTFNAGTLTATTTYNVYAEGQNDYGVNLEAGFLNRLEIDQPYTDFTDEITIEAWVNLNAATAADEVWLSQALVGTDNMTTNVLLWEPFGAEMVWYVNDNGVWKNVISTGIGALDGWHHIATTVDANGMSIYIDGVLDASSTNGVTTGIQSSPNATMHIGGDVRYPLDPNRHGDIGVSEVRVWNVLKTEAEIAADMSNCLIGNESGLVYLNKINDNNGLVATASVGASADFSANMTTANWMGANDVCESACTLEMSTVPTIVVAQPTTSSFNAGDCLAYTVPSGDETYTVSGIYMDTIPNMAGCDSIMTIDVTIGASPSNISETACFTYTVPSGDETYTISGMYNDTIPSTGGCDSIITIDLTINTVDVSVTNNDPTLMAAVAGAGYQWLDCDNGFAVVAGATSQSFSPTSTGSYAVEITENGCVDTSACETTTEVLSINVTDQLEVNIYPNPSNGEVWVELVGSEVGFTLTVLSMDGKILVQQPLNSAKELLDLRDLASGYYLIELTNSNERFINKIRLF